RRRQGTSSPPCFKTTEFIRSPSLESFASATWRCGTRPVLLDYLAHLIECPVTPLAEFARWGFYFSVQTEIGTEPFGKLNSQASQDSGLSGVWPGDAPQRQSLCLGGLHGDLVDVH